MYKKTRNEKAAEKQDKPKWKVGDRVSVNFLGQEYDVTLTSLQKNPQHPDRWMYTGISSKGLVISYIGINNSEKFANINA